MTSITLRSICLLCCVFLSVKAIQAQAPVFNSVTPNSTAIAKFEKLELIVNLTAAYTNPYDYSDIAVTAIFTAPSGRKDTVDGFYMQDFVIGSNGYASPTSTSSFKVRYAPNETGAWSYELQCTNLSGTGVFAAQTFQCDASAAPGFIRKNATSYLNFDNGNQYIPIGEDMGWQSGSVTADYTKWMTKLADNGGNFIRVWMSSWAFGIEWKHVYNGDDYDGLKKYKQSSAFYLDWLLDYCKQKNTYMMLTLNNHGQVSTNVNPEWPNNPYNAANGGPATKTWDFFTNATAKSTLKNRLRYIVARYGYSQNIQSWELFNELLWTDEAANRKADLTAWDDEMSTYIKSKDVYKHLVTTSYGSDDFTTNTWALPNIDFSQTHFYVGSPNIESILAGANQSYLSQYTKPTLNGEFGLGPSGDVLSVDDPNGVHIHNAIWGSTFSGSMGSAMTWWWDNYIEPKDLYYHFKPLSLFVSGIELKNGNYKKVAATSAGGGASDVTVSPGSGYGKAPAGDFTIDAAGTITPGAGSLSAYLFGSTYNLQNRNPPTFHVNFPVSGQFKVVTSNDMSTSSPKITIYLDGAQLLNADAVKNTTYSVDVPAGQHDIKVDNLGIDWAGISNYVFTNIGSPVTTYALKAENGLKAAGYVLNNKYNWQYLKANGGTPPAAVNGASITVPLTAGTYHVQLYSCSTGAVVSQADIAAVGGNLTFPLPSFAWDVAFTAAELSTLPVTSYSFTGRSMNRKNVLFINITASENVKTVYLEKSANGADYKTIQTISNITGKQEYTDQTPLNGNNFYRLKIIDKDGSQRYSTVVKINNKGTAFSAYPNPFTNSILLQLTPGKYQVKLNDDNGRSVFNQTVTVSGSSYKINTASLPKGIYYLSILDGSGNSMGYQKLVK